MKLSVFHTPEQVPAGCSPDCAVVIDVLRATSTMAAALHAGAQAIEVFADIERLRKASDLWPAHGRVRVGERSGTMVPGCDLGNSPLEANASAVGGRRVFMSTTNGTRCLATVAHAPTVITAALTTRRAVVDFLACGNYESVWLVASGGQGEYALEDTVCAGAIADGLSIHGAADGQSMVGNDALVAAVSLYRDWRERLADLLRLACHGQRLLALGRDDDIEYCAGIDQLDIVPVQVEPGVLENLAGVH